MQTIVIASDHAGFEMKQQLIAWMTSQGYKVVNKGTDSPERVDYPDYAHLLSKAIEEHEADYGIVLCGSGNGVNMTVNKHPGIRGALCWNEEIARLARFHNNANVCSLPARFISNDEAKAIVKTFLETGFEGGRHIARIEKIPLR